MLAMMKKRVAGCARAWVLVSSAWGCSSTNSMGTQMAPATGVSGNGTVQGGGAGASAGTGAGGSGAHDANSGAGGGGVGAGTGIAGRTGIAGGAGAAVTQPDAGTPDGSAMPGAGDSGAMPPPATACTAPELKPGDHDMMLQHAGQQRQYTVHVPASYDGTKAVPLVLDFHGWTSSPAEEEAGGSDMLGSGWKAKSETVGFIVVYPAGLGASWNGGALCCGTSQSSGVDDEGFAVDLVKKMQTDACIDPKRVYVTGISNGGAMSHLLACKQAGLFAAAAPVSMGNGVSPCSPSRPISVVMFRGMMDTLVPYTGGGALGFPSAQADFDMWKSANGCTGTPKTTHTFCQTYSACNAGVEVTLCSLPNGSHVLYDDKAEIIVADVAWEAFERQPLP